jgi:hypothetical protein
MMLAKTTLATVIGLYLLDRLYALLLRRKAGIEVRLPDHRHENDQR